MAVDEVAVEDPTDVAAQDQLWLCHHPALYIDLAPLGPPSAQRLRNWTRHDLRATALASLYAPTDTGGAPERPGPDELRRNGHRAAPGTDRRHGVDLVLGAGAGAVGLLTRPHPDGVDADVARHTALVRAEWQLVEVYATPADDDPVARVLDLRDRLAS